MKKIILIASLTASFLLTACSTMPDKIDAIPFVGSYSSLACDKLAEKNTLANDKLKELSEKQVSKVEADAWGIFLLSLPVGRLFSENITKDIAGLKGEVIHIKDLQVKNNCLI
jgi:hypothetical protein